MKLSGLFLFIHYACADDYNVIKACNDARRDLHPSCLALIRKGMVDTTPEKKETVLEDPQGQEGSILKTTKEVRMALGLLRLEELKRTKARYEYIYTSEAIRYLSIVIGKKFKSNTFRDFLEKLAHRGIIEFIPIVLPKGGKFEVEENRGCFKFTDSGRQQLREEIADLIKWSPEA